MAYDKDASDTTFTDGKKQSIKLAKDVTSNTWRIILSKTFVENKQYIVFINKSDATGKQHSIIPKAADDTLVLTGFDIKRADQTEVVATNTLLVDYENASLFPRTLNVKPNFPNAKDAITLSSTQHRNGKYSVRTKIDVSSYDYASAAYDKKVRRAESSLGNSNHKYNKDRLFRYAFSLYVPKDWTADSYKNDDIFFQTKRSSSAPDLDMQIRGNDITIHSFMNDDATLKQNFKDKKYDVVISSFTKGIWYDFVLDVKWTEGTDGFINVFWKKQSDTSYTVHRKDHKGTTLKTGSSYTAGKDGYTKWGNYKPNGGISTLTVPHIYYHDDIRSIRFDIASNIIEIASSTKDGTVIANADSSSIIGKKSAVTYTFHLLVDSSLGGFDIDKDGKIKVKDITKLTGSDLKPRFHIDVQVKGSDGTQYTRTVGILLK